jgi:transposase-like protein
MKYSKELKAKVVARVMAPGNEAMSQLSEEFNLPITTLYTWHKAALRSVLRQGSGVDLPFYWPVLGSTQRR